MRQPDLYKNNFHIGHGYKAPIKPSIDEGH